MSKEGHEQTFFCLNAACMYNCAKSTSYLEYNFLQEAVCIICIVACDINLP